MKIILSPEAIDDLASLTGYQGERLGVGKRIVTLAQTDPEKAHRTLTAYEQGINFLKIHPKFTKEDLVSSAYDEKLTEGLGIVALADVINLPEAARRETHPVISFVNALFPQR